MNKEKCQEDFAQLCATGELSRVDIQGNESLMYGVFAALREENYKNLDKLLPLALEKKFNILEPSFNLAFEYFENGNKSRLDYLSNTHFLQKYLQEEGPPYLSGMMDFSGSMISPSKLEREIAPYQKSIMEFNLQPRSILYLLALEINHKQIERAFIRSIKTPEVAKIILEHKLNVIKDSTLIELYLNRNNPNEHDIAIKKWLENMKFSQKLDADLEVKIKKKALKI